MSSNPGCFGSPTCYTPSRGPCVRCIFKAECNVAQEARARRLHGKYGLDAKVVSARFKQSVAGLAAAVAAEPAFA